MDQNSIGSERRLSRRQFLSAFGRTCIALPMLAGDTTAAGRADHGRRMKVHIFSKHLQWLDYKDMAETAAEIGFDGVDLTVRPRGHVSPESVRENLPQAVDAVKKAGIQITMITTAITDPRDRFTVPILETASRLGIRYYRMGYYRYEDSKSIPETLAEVKPILRDIADMSKHYGISATYQNHAGSRYVGAPLWDLYILFKNLNAEWIGCQFDIRHATVEGGTTWPTDFRLLTPHINTLVAKDFRWTKTDGIWRTENCPLGQGTVDFAKYFNILQQANISAPVSLHLEYPLGGAEKGARQLTVQKDTVIEAMQRDLNFLRNQRG